MNRLRRKKSAAEIAAIRKAVQITDQAWARLLPELKPGRTEKEIAALFEYFQRDLGGGRDFFPDDCRFWAAECFAPWGADREKARSR